MAGGGHHTWYVPDGFVPPDSTGEHPSHEAICVLNVGERDAEVEITLYFEDHAPVVAHFQVGAERTRHVRTNDEETLGASVPVGVPYGYRVRSSVPVIVQHSRLDTTQPALALFTTLALPEE
jgi:hypothetical protein